MVKWSDNIALLESFSLLNFRWGENMALNMIFISDGVGVVIKSTELNDLVKSIPLTTPSLTMKCKLGCRVASRSRRTKPVITCVVIDFSFH